MNTQDSYVYGFNLTKTMKKNQLLLLLLLLPLLTTAQDSLSYQVLGAFRAGKMYLRWAPASVRAWQLGRQQEICHLYT
jgi:hypothetical protein